jgi:hypothetical protein
VLVSLAGSREKDEKERLHCLTNSVERIMENHVLPVETRGREQLESSISERMLVVVRHYTGRMRQIFTTESVGPDCPLRASLTSLNIA